GSTGTAKIKGDLKISQRNQEKQELKIVRIAFVATRLCARWQLKHQYEISNNKDIYNDGSRNRIRKNQAHDQKNPANCLYICFSGLTGRWRRHVIAVI